MDAINNRLSELAKKKASKPYEKQKSSLHRELLAVLAALPTPKTLQSAAPGDILKFLVWKDKAGKTKIHVPQCLRTPGKKSSCVCPTRLASGTVDSMIGKLRAIFSNAGLGGEWDDRLGIGNPASHPSVKEYLKNVKEEQAQARIRPKKAIPIFLDKIERIARHILMQLSIPHTAPLNTYIFSRDLCFFTLDFFSGDRAADLGRVMSREALWFPDKSGVLFQRCFGKTLRGDGQNTFAVRRCSNSFLCPVKNLERYLALCQLINIDLKTGFLFRATTGNSVTEEPFTGSAVYNRLKLYLRAINADEGETPHSSRAGCSITLTLLGVKKGDISGHVGWSSSRMVDFYNDLSDTLKPNAPSVALATCVSHDATRDVLDNYRGHVDISMFKPAVI